MKSDENLRLSERIELVSPADLRPYQRNARTHSDEQVAQIARSIREFGFTNPILVGEDGEIIAGHGRLLAAKTLGLEKVPIIRLGYLTEAQRRALVLADNKLALNAGWDDALLAEELRALKDLDFDMELLGWSDEELDGLLADVEVLEPQSDEDEVPEEPVEPKTKPGDIYQLGRHRLMCGDSTSIDAVERLLSGVKVDMLHTDPPYGLADKWSGGTWGADPMYADAKRWDQPLDQADVDWFATLAPVVIIWGGNYYRMPASRCWLSWTKTQQMETMADFELAWTNLDKVAKAWSGARNADGKRQHPTQKPVGLVEWALSVHADPKTVLDLFGGSGSTLIACEKTGRTAYLMELDPKYCDVIVARWEKYTGKQAVLLTGGEQLAAAE